LSVSQCSFSAFWLAENAISAHSLTGLINSMVLDILVLGLELSANTTTFSLKTQIARAVIH
jgi:hypothetical protein